MTRQHTSPRPGRPPRLLAAALGYAARGWPVLPLHNPAAGGCSCAKPGCSNPGKHPRARRGLHAASTSPDVIIGWWEAWPRANIGVATGELVVVDVDGEPGRASLAALCRDHQPLPVTLRAATARGEHLYFTAAGHQVRNSAGRLGPGVDVRGRGGYVLAPPSRHPTGTVYRWTNKRPIAELPAWLTDLLTDAPHQAAAAALPDLAAARGAPYAQAALTAEAAAVAAAQPGSRNHTLNRAAFALGQLVGAGLADPGKITEELLAAAVAAGLGEREARATIASGLRAGRMRPRQRPVAPRRR